MCQYGQGIVHGVFKEFGAYNLKGFVVWLPMIPGDNVQFAQVEAENFKEYPVFHMWDSECRLSEQFAKSIGADGYALEAGSAVELVKKLVAS